ncbi:metallophosphoesterase [Anaerorhabdus furcosa]|uniref:3',5'-cyclic AMP phosphodiesterase CpdA n=1 Tax=Anaerorhabdus furcosa TaxID=118967 RepID=A0A1T4K767_9FIRM|nr:metallophosphoesterase [Anaerorhabdus furcosa]SJZ38163.1 3',5'-cyclic AMP phosphodiesterase CpdA [Anaerorhabdus furcosa]
MKKLLLILLTITLFGCSQPQAENIPDTIHMVTTTDIHVIDPSLVENKTLYNDLSLNSGDGRLLNYSGEILQAFIDEMLIKKPEYVIITGDLTLDGEKLSHQWLAKQLDQLVQQGIQPLIIPGNHDIMNPSSRTYGSPSTYTSTVSAEEFATIYENCGYGNALYKDENSLSYVYELRDNAWILMLDTAMYYENSALGAESSGKIKSETFDWIEEIGALAKEKEVELISATHHSLIQHNSFFSSSYTLLNTLKAQRIFDEQNIRINLSGHLHAQTIAQKEIVNGTITDICTSSLLVYTNQYGDIHYKPFENFKYTSSEVDIELWAQDNSDNDDLLSFEDYSYEYFKFASTSRGVDRFKEKGFTDEQVKALQDVKGILNCYYFTGNVDEVRDEFKASDFYNWLIEQDDDTKSYILTMIQESPIYPKEITLILNK